MSIEPSPCDRKIINNTSLPIASRVFKVALSVDDETEHSAHVTKELAAEASFLVRRHFGRDDVKGAISAAFITQARQHLDNSCGDFSDPDLFRDALDVIEKCVIDK